MIGVGTMGRNMIKLGSILIFLLLAAGCNPFDQSVDPDAIIEKDCGELNTGKNVLVAYVTRHSSTAGIAENIADVLCGLNHKVDLRYVKNVSSIEDYDAVMLGVQYMSLTGCL